MRSLKPDISEAEIESATAKYAKSLGWKYCRKVKWIGRRGAPDRLFIRNGVHIWIEFKRTGEPLKPHQVREIKRMRRAGATVYVIDSIAKGQAVFDE